jgi:hypothetical protein
MADLLARSRTTVLEEVMRRAGLTQDAYGAQTQPGIWLRRVGDELDGVDLMVPEEFAGAGGSRSGSVLPHDRRVARRRVDRWLR